MKRKKLRKIINDLLEQEPENLLDQIMEAITLYEEIKYSEEKLNSYCRILKLPRNKLLHNFVIGAIRSAIKNHGPITLELTGSVAKRIFKHLLEYNKAVLT